MNYLQIARETLSVESQALAQLSQRLDDEFSQVVALILACEGRLVIGGIGKSGLIGKKMVATFASTGTPSFFLHPTEAFHGDLGMLKPIDIVMLISYSGETDDVNKLIPSLKNFGNKIIALTSNKNSTLARHADYVLDITVEREVGDDERRIAQLDGAAVQLAVLVLKNTQAHQLVRQLHGLGLGVLMGDAQQDQKALSDLADGLAVHGNGGIFYPCQYSSHGI